MCQFLVILEPKTDFWARQEVSVGFPTAHDKTKLNEHQFLVIVGLWSNIWVG